MFDCKTLVTLSMADTSRGCHICCESIDVAKSKLQLKPESCCHFMCDGCIEDLILTDPTDDENPTYPCPFCAVTETRGKGEPTEIKNDTTEYDSNGGINGSALILADKVNIDDSETEVNRDKKGTKQCSDQCIFCKEAGKLQSEEQQHDSSQDSIHTHPAYAELNNPEVSNLELSASGDFCENGRFKVRVKECLLCQNEQSLVSNKQHDSYSTLSS